jgi:glycosyltransferase involved in cell wall biosynthesis
MPGARLVIAGREGNQSELLRSLARDLDLDDDVRFLGGRNDVKELLCAADAFVLPSRWEGLGSVLVEAMALEAPVVASDLPSVREVMGTDGAQLVVPGDSGALAAAVVSALADPTEGERRAQGAYRRFLEHFTVAQAAEGMVGCYRRALEEGPRLARRRRSR